MPVPRLGDTTRTNLRLDDLEPPIARGDRSIVLKLLEMADNEDEALEDVSNDMPVHEGES